MWKTFQVPDLKKPMTLGPNSILIRPNPKIAIPEFLVQYFNEFEGKKIRDYNKNNRAKKI